ncbi:hypothetical protein LOTGIDRAFT_118899 [Lottia gigantea]|uniref:Leishmanolysin-like peptidase n=1 Tax=Lottia gigantea TaxID=225164 RepID=V4ABQ5_LOTGI|nr:hypothetical protein LOTGIDRAFT_118899 [Lottia gigantea]ESO94247.1 hypothetical protein LOTGIDRAFT_118899 [Lottia gigantea]
MHLEGLYLYNKTYDQPLREVYQPGPGVVDTDFILYITSQTTATCQHQDNEVYGYASSCQEDQNGRPIAGVVNFCPEMFFKHQHFTDQHLYTVNNLLNIFIYFQNDVVTSHWDSAMMQGSLMTSDNTMPGLTVLDPITLAVFEDSGWYKVDYSQADRYYWGKDGGCKFGLKQYCDIQTPYFCYGKGRGCHYLGKDKGVCKTDSNIKPCKKFTPTTAQVIFILIL